MDINHQSDLPAAGAFFLIIILRALSILRIQPNLSHS